MRGVRIVSSYRPGDLATGVKKITINSSGILLTTIYCAGVSAGCALYIAAEPIRRLTDRLMIDMLMTATPLLSLALVLVVAALCVSTAVFGAGLSLLGAPCIYLTPFFLGAAPGVFCMAVFGTGLAMGEVKAALLLPVYGVAACALISMCEYAAEMSRLLIRDKSGWEGEETKKYALRIIVLTLSVTAANLLLGCMIVLLRHIS